MISPAIHLKGIEKRMKSQEIMQQQIDSALAGLTRIRERLAGTGATDEPDLIAHDLDWAASHLEDIRHIWFSMQSAALSRTSLCTNQALAR